MKSRQMLVLDIPEMELFDESTDRFITIKPQTLKLEHSLISISKWESKWLKPFLTKDEKTKEELLDYIKCMLVNPLQNYDVISYLSASNINKIINYINSPMTATTITFFEGEQVAKKGETITSELIYYWMISAGIPFECEKWHINRLFSLLKVCSAKNAPKKKTNTPEYMRSQAALNAKRRAKMKSKG